MTSPEPGIDIQGAVDLSAFANRAAQGSQQNQGDFVVEASAATFNQVLQQSQTVPVIVELYSPRSGASTQLSPILQKFANEYAGRFLLARVNAEVETDIAQAFGVQVLPTTVAIINTQPIPLFQGVAEEAQIKQVIDDILRVAAENGVSGTLEGSGEEAQEEEVPEPLPPNIQKAYDAIEDADYAAATQAFEAELATNPSNEEAKAGLIQVALMERLDDHDPQEVLAKAATPQGQDLDSQLLAADVEVTRGEFASAFARVIALVKANSGDDRDRARAHLLDLFQLAPAGSPEVAEARRDLAAALF